MSEKVVELTDILALEKFCWTKENTATAKGLLEEIERNTLLAPPDYKKKFRAAV